MPIFLFDMHPGYRRPIHPQGPDNQLGYVWTVSGKFFFKLAHGSVVAVAVAAAAAVFPAGIYVPKRPQTY